MSYEIGQRWLSHADSELGLGIVVDLETRRVTIHFPAVEEDRTYARDNAPLTRLRLRQGESLNTRDGRILEVVSVQEEHTLIIYAATDGANVFRVPELDLDANIDLGTPRQRLIASQFDSHAAFSLRLETCRQQDRLQRSGLRGLLGTRTALLPHQLYVANEVGRRHAPRVLLADEVGLGKTIEAGMILHRQLLTGDSQRVLIMVPESLQYQWLVEMRRRFNLNFALFDDARLDELPIDNAFESEQLVLCATTLFEDPLRREQALATSWDLVIVDEVHRVHWSRDNESQEFQFLRELSEASAGLLLLTATPEQVGQEAHFARLALLDPARFHDFDNFREEESSYRQWSGLLEALDRGESPPGLPEDIDQTQPPAAQIAQLIDRHGTGRVLFRNARAAVRGFPERLLSTYPLSASATASVNYHSLYPEIDADGDWLTEDPRVSWLVAQLKSLRPAKVLVICAQADTALALETYLQLRAGIRSAAFHEHLSLLERDRAAAYFADSDQGAQALICSEIGSEGRNFQFAQHLILFDLPGHPDQLEQRIGRLDRIGQRDRIYIHAPYIEGGAQETLLRWYDEGLNLFCESCSAGDMILRRFRQRLEQQLQQRDEQFEQLLQETADFTATTRSELSEGRDRMLERSSCDSAAGTALAEAIAEIEDPLVIGNYLETLCDVTGIEHEHHSEHSVVLRPGEQEVLAVFPELSEDGHTVTVSRDVALLREDFMFLGWEHPWLDGAMDSLMSSHLGQAAVGVMDLKGVPAGSRLYEMVFTASLRAPRALQLQRYLPLSPLRLLLDARGRDLSELLSHERLNERIEKLQRGAASKIVRQLRVEIEARIDEAEQQMEKRMIELRDAALATMYSAVDAEIQRLEALRRVNPAVRAEEIAVLETRKQAGSEALLAARPVLQAVRLVLTR
ncbi:MAG: ATP-dependent helicase HepA [Halieaceae bacterium]|jgi:ATP-dependent helicase HepA